MRIVIDENMPAVESFLGSGVQVHRVPGRDISRHHLTQADALMVRSVTRVDASLLQGTAVRFVGSATAGTDHIDREGLAAAGVTFAHAPGANANSVVEYILGAIASVDDYLEQLLAGGTLGIVGYGFVGRALANRLSALGIEYCACDPWLDQSVISNACNLEQIQKCDVICLHAELTVAEPWPSYHLFDALRLDTLNERQLLINASRGAVIDNTALLARLAQPAAPQVVLDVWENEPAINASLLQRVRLGTPHIAGYSFDSKVLASRMLCEALAAVSGLSVTVSSGDSLAAGAALELDSPASDAEVIRHLLASCCSIERDDEQLRAATFNREPDLAAQRFDALRKAYPQRRELAARQVMLGRGAARFNPVVTALGCETISQES